MPAHHARGLIIIGCFNLFKAVLLFGLGVGLWRLLHGDLASGMAALVDHLRVDPNNQLVHRAVERVLGIDRRHLKAIDAGTFVYAAVFATEGVGLLLEKRWAEYVTLAVTASFIPLEAFELIKHASLAKAAVLLINVAIAVYLARELRKH